MIYKLYYRMVNLLNGNKQIESIAGEDLEKLRIVKRMINNSTFGHVMIESAFIMDQNMLYINDNY